MNFDSKIFIKELQEQFREDLTPAVVADLLDLEDAYTKDSPISTGKNLQVTNVFFTGQKITEEQQDYSDSLIGYEQQLNTGINIWIADNLKGKSSVLKIIKFALTGRNSLKGNIKKWIKHIVLNFTIGEKEYSIYLNMEGRLKASLLNGNFSSITAINEVAEPPLIYAKSELDYENQIQDFFFKQFSYYPLKWTQKSSVKHSTDLLEVETSWVTYFKSIFLESKDSNTLIIGDQGKKVFQMLLGLELTYPINRLTVKKDLIQEKKGKQLLYEKMGAAKVKEDQAVLEAELQQLNAQIETFNQNSIQKVNVNDLYTRYNLLLQSIKNRNEKIYAAEENINLLRERSKMCDNRIRSIDNEILRMNSELERNTKRIADLKEFLDIGIFFSNLDIKRCPSCDHSVTDDKKKLEKEQHKCALCSEDLTGEEEIQDKEVFLEKILNLDKTNGALQKDLGLLLTEKENFEAEVERNSNRLISLTSEANGEEDNAVAAAELKEIEAAVNTEKEKVTPATELDKLIRDKTILEFRIEQLAKTEMLPDDTINYDKQIELLDAALLKLNGARFELGTQVLIRLEGLMLSEIHEFGLKSITQISISDKYEILYKQDGEFVSFDNIAEGEQLRAKIAFYLSLIQLDIEFNFGRHTRFLMIDSPGKEEGDASYLEGLSVVLKSVQLRFGDKLQILIGTAERGLSNIVENEYITPVNTYVF